MGVLAVVLVGLNNPASKNSILKFTLFPEFEDTILVFNFYKNDFSFIHNYIYRKFERLFLSKKLNLRLNLN